MSTPTTKAQANTTGFSIGDVVQLRCGGPLMVVNGITTNDGTVQCTWTSPQSGDVLTNSFDHRIIRRATG